VQLPTVYQQALRERFEELHPDLRRFLGSERGGSAAGRLRVMRVGGVLRGLAASALGIPPAGEYELRLHVSPQGGKQRWVRRFGEHVLETSLSEQDGLLLESTSQRGHLTRSRGERGGADSLDRRVRIYVKPKAG